MIDAGIHSGNIVVVDKRSSANVDHWGAAGGVVEACPKRGAGAAGDVVWRSAT